MLLTSMTYREMYDHLAADKYKVDIKQEYLRPKAIKAFRKTSRFPAWELYEYKIPATNNQYIIYMQKPGPVQNIPKSALSVLFMQTNIGLSFNGVQAGISTPRIAKW